MSTDNLSADQMVWRPIHTIPQDGCACLITDGKFVTVADVSRPKWRGGKLFFTGHCWDGYEWEFDFLDFQITHWMPLPEPPK